MIDRDHDHDRDQGAGPEEAVVWPCKPDASGRCVPRYVRERSRLWWSIGLTAATMVGEAAAGLLVGSLALVSDAGHMLTHAFALCVSLAAISLAAHPASPERSFGHHRVEILAALLNGVVLLAASGWIAWEAVERFREPVEILDLEMLIVAVVGLAVNVTTMLLLRNVGRRNLNIRSAFLHMVGDTVSSIAVVAGAVVIGATSWLWVDPALSIGICILILVWSIGLIRDAVHVLLEAAPRGISIERIRRSVRDKFPQVTALADIHVWAVAPGMVVMTARVAVDTESLADCYALGMRLEEFFMADFGIGHVTLQFVPRAATPPSHGAAADPAHSAGE